MHIHHRFNLFYAKVVIGSQGKFFFHLNMLNRLNTYENLTNPDSTKVQHVSLL